MNRHQPQADTENSNRRGFLKSVSGTAVAASVAPLVLPGTPQVFAEPARMSPKYPVKAFYASLTDSQKKIVCLPVKSELERHKAHDRR